LFPTVVSPIKRVTWTAPSFAGTTFASTSNVVPKKIEQELWWVSVYMRVEKERSRNDRYD
jgi:acyl dehydratase